MGSELSRGIGFIFDIFKGENFRGAVEGVELILPYFSFNQCACVVNFEGVRFCTFENFPIFRIFINKIEGNLLFIFPYYVLLSRLVHRMSCALGLWAQSVD